MPASYQRSWRISEEFKVKIRHDTSEEILGQTSEPKNWKGPVIAVLIILAFCGLIATSILLVMPKKDPPNPGESVTFGDVFNNTYKPLQADVQWLNGSSVRYAYIDSAGSLVISDANTNDTRIVVDKKLLKGVQKATLSQSEQYVLLTTKTTDVRSHTMMAEYIIHDIQAKKDYSVKGSGKQLQYAAWIPNTDVVVYVDQNDVHILSEITGGRVGVSISTGGNANMIYNGVPDPLYEDVILKTDNAIWPSGNGRFLVYATFDDSLLPIYPMAKYNDGSEYYPIIMNQKYPKAGMNCTNPVVTLWLVNTAAGSASGYDKTQLILPSSIRAREYYLTSVKWIDNENVFVGWLSRSYDHVVHTVCGATSFKCEVAWEKRQSEGSDKNEALLQFQTAPVFASEGARPAYFMLSHSKADRDGPVYRHIEKVNSSQNAAQPTLTHGAFDDVSIVAFDKVNTTLYYITTAGDPRDRHLYSLDISPSASGENKEARCISCDIQNCKYVDATFNNDCTWYLLACLGPGVPTYRLRRTVGDKTIILQDNVQLADMLKGKAIPTEHLLKVKSTEGDDMWMRVLVPSLHRKELLSQYGLVVSIPSEGPGSQTVTNKFHLGWETYLASSRNYVVATINTRGSGNQGQKFEMDIYGDEGMTAAIDVIQAMSDLLGNKSMHLDANKTAVVGEGYGGLVALHTARVSSPVKCVAAISPITDLRHYYTAVAERYVGNFAATSIYEKNKLQSHSSRYKNTALLLVHGLADDRYHFQNTANLMRDLQSAGVQYKSSVQASSSMTMHYRNVDSFITQCFG